MYSLYSINKATNAMTKLADGTAGAMRKRMNMMRHVNAKDARYALYQGNTFMGATNN